MRHYRNLVLRAEARAKALSRLARIRGEKPAAQPAPVPEGSVMRWLENYREKLRKQKEQDLQNETSGLLGLANNSNRYMSWPDQVELTFFNEDRTFVAPVKYCPLHVMQPILRREMVCGKATWRCVCQWDATDAAGGTHCPFTQAEAMDDKELALRLWNLQVVLSK